MKILIDEQAQVSTELILLFGGIITIALIALVVYNNYLQGLGNTINNSSNPNSQINQTDTAISNLKNLFS